MFYWFQYLYKPTVVAGDVFLFHVKLTQDKAILYEDLEFIADHSDNLNSTLERGAFDAVVRGMSCIGPQSLHGILEESPSEDDSESSEGESSGFPLQRACNAVIPAIPITTTPLPEETPEFQIVPMRPR
jgi:hypothetical protein